MVIGAGSRLGAYEILSPLGRGGMGVVYRAYDSKLQRSVAIKVLGSLAIDEAGRQRLLHEARAASALNHPNVCTIHEVSESDGQPYIVMELVDGKPLSESIPPAGLPPETIVRYGLQLADALAHAHDRGLLHCDLKSSNVIVTRDGRLKVVDFGLATRLRRVQPDVPTSSNTLIVDHIMAGTLSYMAPEILQGDAPTAASDVWSLGVLLYELASGHLPFSGRTPFDLTAAILHEAPAPLPARTPASVRMIIGRCLSRELSERYRAAGEVRAALQAVQSDAVVSAPSRAAPPHRSVSAAQWGLAAALVIALLGGFYIIARSTRQAAPTAPPASGRLALVFASDRRAFDPALSPDGKMIAYVAQDEGGRLNLFVSRVAGGGRVRLTDDDTPKSQPRFSADGERILFTRRRQDGGVAELCLVPALGGEVSVVLEGAVEAAWSPGGDRIAFVKVRGAGATLALETARPDGSDRRQLLVADAAYPYLGDPAWSPDGKFLAVVRGTGGVAAEIWLLAADGGQLHRLSNDAPAIFSDEPIFTPDGRAVIHSSNRGGATNIWSLPIDGRAPVRLTTGPGPDGSPTIAKNGDVAFVDSRWRNELVVVDRASGRPRTLLTHAPFLWRPSFSPDGRDLVYSRGEVDGSWHLWIVPAAGGSPRQLTAGALGEVYSSYSPDGESIIYHTWGSPRRVWRIPRQGGPPVALTPPGIDATFGDLSPDGSTLAFVATEDQKIERVYTVRLSEGKARLLTKSPASVPRWSPDGRQVAFSPDRTDAGGVFVVRGDGTEERQLTKTGGMPVWGPGPREISYTLIMPDGRQQLRVLTLDGSTPDRSIEYSFNGPNFPLEYSPDRRSFATSNSIHVSDEIWLLKPAP